MLRELVDMSLPKFKDRRLEFHDDRITQHMPEHWLQSPAGVISPWSVGPLPEVMMNWEADLMKRHAEVVCENGGDILEIGFGMGISADFIQALNPTSHTIVEIHPQVLEKLDAWAADKPNVKIVKGDWYKKYWRGKLGIYDGIFYDGFGDNNMWHLKEAVHVLSKPGTIVTFWNNLYEESNIYGFENATYERLAVGPENNGYFQGDFYYLLTVVL